MALGSSPPGSSLFAHYLSGAAGQESFLLSCIFIQEGYPVSFKLGQSLQSKFTNYVICLVPSPKFWIILVRVGKCWGKEKEVIFTPYDFYKVFCMNIQDPRQHQS